MPSLGKREKCPIHRSYFCCGRSKPAKSVSKGISHHGPVTRIPDPTHPRGYREICTPAELKRRKDIKIKEQYGKCWLCGDEFDDYRDVEPDHEEPRGIGGSTRDDHIDNIHAVHRRCNSYKGSRRDIENVQKELREMAKQRS